MHFYDHEFKEILFIFLFVTHALIIHKFSVFKFLNNYSFLGFSYHKNYYGREEGRLQREGWSSRLRVS